MNNQQSANLNIPPSMNKNKDLNPLQNPPSLSTNSPNLKQFPLNCLCYIKIKICTNSSQKQLKPLKSIYGSGVMIDKQLVLTVAHNVIQYNAMKEYLINLKKEVLDESYVKLALLNGQNEGVFQIQQMFISERYASSQIRSQDDEYYDYALLKIKPRDEKVIQRVQFPIPLAIQYLSSYSNKLNLSIWGYPINANLDNTPRQNHHNSSIIMANPSGGEGQFRLKPIDHRYIYYQIETDKGTSGAPIFTKLFDKDVFIGLHKASDSVKSTDYPNFGINMLNCIKQVNQWGYKIFEKKRPIIFTPATIQLHKNSSRITNSQLIFYLDKGITLNDLYVITSYDLSSIKKIMLSGNKIHDEGFMLLTKRKLPVLDSLFVASNNLMQLGRVKDQNWDNISTVKALALNINKLKEFPEKIIRLMNLKQLWLSYNNISDISDAFIQFCNSRQNETVIHIYKNRIPLQNVAIKNAMKIIQKTNVTCHWQRIHQ